jgi:hypothetical protein
VGNKANKTIQINNCKHQDEGIKYVMNTKQTVKRARMFNHEIGKIATKRQTQSDKTDG